MRVSVRRVSSGQPYYEDCELVSVISLSVLPLEEKFGGVRAVVVDSQGNFSTVPLSYMQRLKEVVAAL